MSRTQPREKTLAERKKQNVSWGSRLWLTFITIFVTALTFVEVSVALNLEFARPWTHRAMLSGSIIWIAVAAIGAYLSMKESGGYRFGHALFVTVMAAGSVAGFYTEWMMTFALWVNAILFILFFAVVLWLYPKAWRDKDFEPPFKF